MSTAASIASLIIGYLREDLSAEESVVLNNWLAASADNRLLFDKYTDMELLTGLYKQDAASKRKVWEGLEIFMAEKQDSRASGFISDLQSAADTYPTANDLPLQPTIVHRVHFLRRGWLRYAAAVLIIICGVGGYFLVGNKKTERLLVNKSGSLQTDIPPGGDKAVLTLADGRVILLDSAANGNLAQQGNAAIVKLANGQIAYNLKGLAGSDVMMNTMSTPRGGQYQLTLPDGSKVWLNAASSITFPAAFVGGARNVKITGEAYFEVAKNKEKPFIVDVDGKSTVQVLGTSFNVNSYTDDGDIKATLVEGSVRVLSGNTAGVDASSDRQTQSSVILKPGQQAVMSSEDISVRSADIEQTLAWKNGIFNFNGLGVRAVMAQLSRWYDINVRYEGPMPTNIFRGEMYRNENLSFVLDGLPDMGIKYRMEGKTVIVSQIK